MRCDSYTVVRIVLVYRRQGDAASSNKEAFANCPVRTIDRLAFSCEGMRSVITLLHHHHHIPLLIAARRSHIHVAVQILR